MPSSSRALGKLCEVAPAYARELGTTRGRLRFVAGRNTGLFEAVLRQAQLEFRGVPRRNGGARRPLIGLVGEFFVRLHDGSNQHIIRKLEQAGAEVWLAPMTEFFIYANCIGGVLTRDEWEETHSWAMFKDSLYHSLYDRLASRDEHHLFEATLPYLEGFDDIGPREIIENGARYVHYTFGGETICSLGKAVDFARRGLDGVVNVLPFNCMPGNAVAMLSHTFRRDHDNLPFLNLDYDGFVDSTRDARIISFISQVKERRAARRELAKV